MAAGEEALKTIESIPDMHVGGASEAPGKCNYWNPSNKRYSCTAGVCATIKNSQAKAFRWDTDSIEEVFGSAGIEKHLSVEDSLDYIKKATGLNPSTEPVSMLMPDSPVGHYAIYTKWSGDSYHHVVYGRVTPTGKVVILDAQTMRSMTYAQMQEQYGRKARPYLLEAE